MAGLPKGRTNNPGGRPKGAKNKATAKREQEIAQSGLTPMDFLLTVMRDDNKDLDTRIEAAKAVAPYVHPKLSSVDATVSGKDGGPIEQSLTVQFIKP
jgi:hypothetical protein